MISGSLWNYYEDKINEDANENNNANNYRINHNKARTSKSFECNAKTKGRMANGSNILDAEVAALLKYLSNFWRYLDLSLNDCEIEIDLKWTKNCIIPEISITASMTGNLNANRPVPAVAATATTDAKK